MGLEFVPGVSGLLDALGEAHVDVVPLFPHVVGAHVQTILHLVPQLSRAGAFALRALNVVVAELGPRLRYGQTDEIKAR